jgi:hypothetical protein
MTRQPDLFLPAVMTVRARQGELFPDDEAETGPPCRECGRPMVRTPSGFLSCPRAHGKLIEPPAAEVRPPGAPACEQEPIRSPWPEQARRLAKRHARRDRLDGAPPCECGHCVKARDDQRRQDARPVR